MPEKLRVVLAKPGLDGHNRGIQHIARSLMEAGFEVVYLGLYQTPAQMVRAALQEDAHVIGISSLACAPIVTICEEVMGLLRDNGGEDIMLIVGGIIHPDEVVRLKEIGVGEVFGPGTHTKSIIDFINENVGVRTPGSAR